jgi:hypothetical protein
VFQWLVVVWLLFGCCLVVLPVEVFGGGGLVWFVCFVLVLCLLAVLVCFVLVGCACLFCACWLCLLAVLVSCLVV